MKGVILINKYKRRRSLNKAKQWLVFTGYVAFAWSMLFGLIHIYWAAGGTIGFEGRKMSEVLFMINLLAIVLCFLAAFIALALVQAWGQNIPKWILFTSTWTACVVLTLRGGVGITQSMLQPETPPLLFIIVEPYFLLGGILFGLSAFLYFSSNTNMKKQRREKI
ncbi:DUF3995 domain-containing protein [Piscibacillus halophilus]|uniref:DUF3995 domain-containing protein n=1 Tax=Piscibacillus halophilus TaxID=571933 RepID=UPI00158B631E|nr:DUF3995 domain-containing protein [Piscibacillus halophilus]